MGTPVIKLFYVGLGSKPEQDFCDHWDNAIYDNVECDDSKLWAIEEDDMLVGYVCDPHKDAYKREMGIE
jgi:hypothetical protein